MALSLVLIVVGLIGLYFGGDLLVRGASRIATTLGLSPLAIGLTVVAVGTSAPELLVNSLAAFRGANGMALGNIIGSNVANIGLILGITGLVAAITVQSSVVKRDIPIMIGATLLVAITTANGKIGRIEGAIMVLAFIAYTVYTYRQAHSGSEGVPVDDDIDPATIKRGAEIIRFVAGVGLLAVGAQLLVVGAEDIAHTLGISDLVIGITIVAFGTSLPELTSSITAAREGKTELALGNVVGSNIANLLLVLGLTTLIAPITVEPGQMRFGFISALVFSLFLFPLARDRVFSRRESALLLVAYLIFLALVLFWLVPMAQL